ncbi:MAG: amidohydrolase family protein [Nitrospirae bacterium]|nr:amidohydrolase family protein [Nitrospirota bacterium]
MHFMLDGRSAAPDQLLALKKAYAGHGIFAVTDMGHRNGPGLQAKSLFQPEIEVISAGIALYRHGTYGSFLGKGVSDTSKIINAVNEIADAGADFIKAINSGIVSPEKKGLVSDGGFSYKELYVLCETAHSRGLHVVCHANSDAAVLKAVKAGVRSIEHGFFVSRETLHRMADSGIAWVPTIFALRSLERSYPAAERSVIERTVDEHLSSVNYAASIGVPLFIGTDSGSKGVPHGSSFFDELRLFKKAGLSSEQIIKAACMHESEIDKGNYLLVTPDFMVRAVFKDGRQAEGVSFNELDEH